MPFEIIIPELPGGYATSSAKAGERVVVVARGFVSSEDGDLFVGRLEGFPSTLISLLPRGAHLLPSGIDHMLAVIKKDKTATVYVNEIKMLLKIQAKPDVNAGELVTVDDIADVRRLQLVGIEIPSDAGFVFLFSVGWRKGLVYDFSVFHTGSSARDYDVGSVFGQYYAYLAFQHLFKISEEEWQLLFKEQWFPFISLHADTVKQMLAHVRSGWSVDELLDRVAGEVRAGTPSMIRHWEKNRFFQPHLEFLKTGIERYAQKDYISANSVLYPRIEGVMRSLHASAKPDEKPSQKGLVSTLSETVTRHDYSLLLPRRFKEFLEVVYFASFDPRDPAVLSRHSVAHGVARPEHFSLKAASIGLLILEQMSYYLKV